MRRCARRGGSCSAGCRRRSPGARPRSRHSPAARRRTRPMHRSRRCRSRDCRHSRPRSPGAPRDARGCRRPRWRLARPSLVSGAGMGARARGGCSGRARRAGGWKGRGHGSGRRHAGRAGDEQHARRYRQDPPRWVDQARSSGSARGSSIGSGACRRPARPSTRPMGDRSRAAARRVVASTWSAAHSAASHSEPQ